MQNPRIDVLYNYITGLFFGWSSAFACLRCIFSFAFNAGFLKEFTTAQLGENTFLLNAFVESPE
jgi:hypothetical protein